MEGLRINKFESQLKDARSMLSENDNIETIQIVHEIIDDTPFKTENYMQYDHDEYYIEHMKVGIEDRFLKTVPLKFDQKEAKPLKELIIKRYSLRDFVHKSMSFETLSNILYYSFGVKHYGRGAYARRKFPFKYANSAGGLNYFDLYIFVMDVDGLESGIYYYDFINNQLGQLDYGNVRKIVQDIHYQNEFVTYANFVAIPIADLSRIVPKYLKRSYRFAHVDSGILLSYMQLMSENEGAHSCLVAGYLEHMLEDVLELNSWEIPMCSLPVGYK